MNRNQGVTLSLCRFVDGTFELYIIDPATKQEVQIEGRRVFTDEESALLDRLMPACVWTTYERTAS